MSESPNRWGWAIGQKILVADTDVEPGRYSELLARGTIFASDGTLDLAAGAYDVLNRPGIELESLDSHGIVGVLDVMERYLRSHLTRKTPDTASGRHVYTDRRSLGTRLASILGPGLTMGNCTDDGANQRGRRVRADGFSSADAKAAIARGETKFTTVHVTEGGTERACADCHDQDGSGFLGPDIRTLSVDQLIDHARGQGRHFEGVKFTTLSDQDFHDIRFYLASICQSDSECMPGTVDQREHE